MGWVFVASLILWLPLVIYNGWALSVLWVWFVVPTFGLTALSLGQAIGISLVVGFFIARPASLVSDEDKMIHFLNILSFHLLAPIATVGAGWVYLKVFF